MAAELERRTMTDRRDSNMIWTEDALDTYLASPPTAIGTGIEMIAHGVRDDDTGADLIEFLKHALWHLLSVHREHRLSARLFH